MPKVWNPVDKDDILHLGQVEGGDSGTEPGWLHQEQLSGQSLPVYAGDCQSEAEALGHLQLARVVRVLSLAKL